MSPQCLLAIIRERAMDWEEPSHLISTTENCPQFINRFLYFSCLINRAYKIHKMSFIPLNRLAALTKTLVKQHLQERPETIWKQPTFVVSILGFEGGRRGQIIARPPEGAGMASRAHILFCFKQSQMMPSAPL